MHDVRVYISLYQNLWWIDIECAENLTEWLSI